MDREMTNNNRTKRTGRGFWASPMIVLAAVMATMVAAAGHAAPSAPFATSSLKKTLDRARLELAIGTRYFKALDRFYRSRSYRPAWINPGEFSNNAKAVLGVLFRLREDGLDPAEFPLPKSAGVGTTLMDDIKLSFSLVRYGEHVQAGRLSPDKIVAEFDLQANRPDFASLLKQASEGKAPLELLQNLPPPHLQYRRLKRQLVSVLRQTEKLLEASAQINQRLSAVALAGLRAKKQLLTANMERWRWVPRDLGPRHVWINLPSYKVQIKHGAITTFETDGIIGRTTAPTPLISSTIKNIIINPFWHLPASVVARDILPNLKTDAATFLASRSIKVLRRGGRVIDPASINWTKITNPRSYRFRQSPGIENALGRLKILFPNSHSIYLHDTNEPELFGFDNRAFSHGCVRLADPVKFADAIAKYDNHLHTQMPGSLLANQDHWLKFRAKLPVHLVYFTAEVDADGRLVTFPDVYGYDRRIISLFDGDLENT